MPQDNAALWRAGCGRVRRQLPPARVSEQRGAGRRLPARVLRPAAAADTEHLHQDPGAAGGAARHGRLPRGRV